MFKKGREKVSARVAVARALSAVRQALLKVKLQEKRLEYTAKKDPVARRMLENLYEIEHVLEFLSLRLETLAVTGIVPLSELDVPLRLIRGISRGLGGSPPDILSLLGQAEESLRRALESYIPPLEEVVGAELKDVTRRDEVEDILREAKVVAERKLEKVTEG